MPPSAVGAAGLARSVITVLFRSPVDTYEICAVAPEKIIESPAVKSGMPLISLRFIYELPTWHGERKVYIWG
jgi:hypothetical protein